MSDRKITLKTRRELKQMRRAGRIIAEAFELAEKTIAPGVTTGDLNRRIEDLLSTRGARFAFKVINGFPAACCISVNEEIVHGIPGPRKLAEGDIVSIDIGTIFNKYCADACRTFMVGDVSAEARRLVEATRHALDAGVSAARAGNMLFDISRAVEETAAAAGLGVVRELVGHGIGKSVWEAPQVPNYVPGGDFPNVPLVERMALAIEPMLSTGSGDIHRLADGWTYVTRDGGLAAHFEDTIAIRDGEPAILTKL